MMMLIMIAMTCCEREVLIAGAGYIVIQTKCPCRQTTESESTEENSEHCYVMLK